MFESKPHNAMKNDVLIMRSWVNFSLTTCTLESGINQRKFTPKNDEIKAKSRRIATEN